MGLRSGGPDSPLTPRLRVFDRQVGAVVHEAGLRCSHPPPDGDQAAQPWFDGTWLWQPTRTAIHRVDPESLAAEQVLTHPWFHDVHSLTPGPDGWLVTCTGHEAVLEIDADGHVHQRWQLGPPLPDGIDARTLPHDHFKPHAWHPNRAFAHGDQRWVTCLSAQACVGLDHDGRLDLGPDLPHDGVLRQGRRWFTTVQGVVIAVDPGSLERVFELDVAALEDRPGHFGWCRGIEVVEDRLYVGVTTLRGSTWREAARRLVRGPRQPTRLLEVDWRNRRLLRRWPLESEGSLYGITAIAR